MGREVYLFSLINTNATQKQLCDSFISLGYSYVSKDESEVHLEKGLVGGFIEVCLIKSLSNDEYFIRIAKPNSNETVSVLIQDVKGLKKGFIDLILYDIEARRNVDLVDETTLKKRFSKARNEFLSYFPSVNKAPVRSGDVFNDE